MSPAEIKLIEALLNVSDGKIKVKRLIYDKAEDSDPLRMVLKKRGIDLICHIVETGKKRRLQDGRKLRRYDRRWKVERTFAWLGNYRRLVVRWERKLSMYRAFFHAA
ncbi:hypothetical protein CHH28_07120 [Bacterioplanes sanyensis]|uniref:Transposase IS4-like domain-containing protein n=1 Tax=Bacterioplanes sanyensis TaxID=1249553 RepID=A0A222FIN2_9GAMM|nr:transposase [Bacterioplanes sanyensis]ASP38456.1 hypothetical protein CHH28_07120 [Bacterioplanes sanyensis]